MTTGEGIFWAAVLVLLVLGFRYLSKTKRWKLAGKIVGAFIALCLIIGSGIYFYNLYKNRPTQQTSLFGISLGMQPVEVRLALGEPKGESESENKDALLYLYETYSWEGADKYVRFRKKGEDWHVSMICNLDPSGELYDLYTFTDEDKVLKKFGQPTNQSVNQDGLKKFLTFGPLNIAVEIEKGNVATACVTNESIQYADEYNGEN